MHGFAVDVIPVDCFGQVTVEALAAVLRPGTALVSVMYANNEVGTVQPVAASRGAWPTNTASRSIPMRCRPPGGCRSTSAALGVDALSISGHKLGAPKGIGALFLRGRTRLEPLLHGGGQERGRRSGTENVAGAVALATALTLAEADGSRRRRRSGRPDRGAAGRLHPAVLAGVPGARPHRPPRRAAAPVASFCFAGTSGEAVLLELERHGVVCSSGSACAAGSDEPSPVLLAMGIDAEVAQTAVRFSFDATITAAELQEAASAVRNAVGSVRALGPTG